MRGDAKVQQAQTHLLPGCPEARLAGLASPVRMLVEVLAIGERLGPTLITAVTQDDGLTVADDTRFDLEGRGLLTIAVDSERHERWFASTITLAVRSFGVVCPRGAI